MIAGIIHCKRCPLSLYQKPILDLRRNAEVIWLGISSKIVTDKFNKPLDPHTMSGRLIEKIEKQLPSINFYSSNLVKCAPINDHGKLRYPSKDEIRSCSHNLNTELVELQPKIVVMLGEKVSRVVLKNIKINIERQNAFIQSVSKVGDIIYVAATHPSYINVYKRHLTDQYINVIKTTLYNLLFNYVQPN